MNDKSRKDYKGTYKLCNSLYAETFTIFGQGAFGGDRDADWLTDSVNFRIYVGVFDDAHGGISYECKQDTIVITQRPDDLDVNKHLKSPLIKKYLLKDLRQLNNLNDY